MSEGQFITLFTWTRVNSTWSLYSVKVPATATLGFLTKCFWQSKSCAIQQFTRQSWQMLKSWTWTFWNTRRDETFGSQARLCSGWGYLSVALKFFQVNTIYVTLLFSARHSGRQGCFHSRSPPLMTPLLKTCYSRLAGVATLWQAAKT